MNLLYSWQNQKIASESFFLCFCFELFVTCKNFVNLLVDLDVVVDDRTPVWTCRFTMLSTHQPEEEKVETGSKVEGKSFQVFIRKTSGS